MLKYHNERKISQSSSVDSEMEITVEFGSSATDESIDVIPSNKRNVMRNDKVRRKKSAIEKDEELTTVKIEALNQLENTIKMADIIVEKTQRISELEKEVKSLKQELNKCQYNLIESKSINKEIMDKLESLAQTNSRQKIDLDNLRTEHFASDILNSPITPETAYSIYLKDIYESREKLLEENLQLFQTIDEQRKQIFSLESYIRHFEETKHEDFGDYKHIEETTFDNRSTSDLLSIIRRHMDEKMVWMEYAIKLTQEAVERYPQLFGINTNEELVEHSCTHNKCQWAKLVILILNKVSQSYPQLLREIIISADLDEKKYIEINLK